MTAKGAFKIKSYEVGSLDLDWALVEVPRAVADPKTPADFALDRAHVVAGRSLKGIARYATGAPRLVIRDAFTLDKPKQRIRTNDGCFELEVFEKSYRVFNVTTGELLLKKAGVGPYFSPTGRFLVVQVEGDKPLEAYDLVTGQRIYSGQGWSSVWGNGDTVFMPETTAVQPKLNDGWLRNLGISVWRTLVDGAVIYFDEYSYSNNPSHHFLVSVDIDASIAFSEQMWGLFEENKVLRSLLETSVSTSANLGNV